MIAVVQRVLHARVQVGAETVGAIGPGMLIFLGILRGDGEVQARRLAERIARFRFFRDSQERMNVSALDGRYEALVVSQFTLAADGKSGRRPSFDRAAPPLDAEPLYGLFVASLGRLGLSTQSGRFGTRMVVELANDGPVTFVIEDRAADHPLDAKSPASKDL